MAEILHLGRLAGLTALAIGLAGCFDGREVVEAAEVVAQGDEEVLPESGELRPIRGTTRLLIFAIDGLSYGVLEELVRQGRMPRLAELFGRPVDGQWAHAHAAPRVLSVLPSTTVASWSSIFTGEGPAHTGITGNEQWLRGPRVYFAPAPVSASDMQHVMDTVNDDAVGRWLDAPTLYERLELRAHVSMSHVHRGADLFTMPGGVDLFQVMGTFAVGALDGDHESGSMEVYRDLDHESVDAVLEAAEEHGVPDVQTIYFPGIDLYTHVAADPLEEQKRYLADVLDADIGRVLDHWREQGALQSTYVVFTSDHGHTPVLADDRHSLHVGEEDEPTHVLEELGFRLHDHEAGELEEATFQAAVAYQGAFAYVYLADRSTCEAEDAPCDWSRAPRLAEDVLPVAHAFWEANATGAHVSALEGTLELVLARPPRPVGEDALTFQVYDGERLVPVGEYLTTHPNPTLLAFEARLEDLAAGPHGHRAGDVLLFAKSGLHRPIEERFYFSGEYHSWHGSPFEQDSHVPLVVAHPNVDSATLRARVERAMPARLEGWSTQLDFVRLACALVAEE